MSDTNGGVILTVTGQIIMLMTPAQTRVLPAEIMAYHLDLADPVGTPTINTTNPWFITLAAQCSNGTFTAQSATVEAL